MTKEPRKQREEERLSIIGELGELDRHGVWTDEQSKNEGYSNMTLREARKKRTELLDPKNH